ncbi:MAG: AAA family ATPase [Opitutales bacterium]|nr:AAA family ATPase [Opitutales bacterium]
MIYDAHEIKRLLANDAERFCSMYLRHGRKYGPKEWRCSDIQDSGSGKSFVVTLTGSKAGLWYENSTGESGHIIDIICKQKDVTFREALKIAQEFLGIQNEDNWKNFQKKSTPSKKISSAELTPVKEGMDSWVYLTQERGLKPLILKAYGVCENAVPVWHRDVQRKVKSIAFPVYQTTDKANESVLVNIKYLGLERPEGKKLLAQHPLGTNHLIFMNRIPRNARSVIICEGEIDALTMAGAGFNAVSVPAGAHGDRQDGQPHANNEWLTNDYIWLAGFEEIYLCFDNDEAGRNAERSLFYRLGVERTKVIRIPNVDEDVKDPNSYARYCAENGLDADAELAKLVKNATALNPETIKYAVQYREQLHDLMFPKDGKAPGYVLPNANFGEHFMIRLGEVSAVTGFGGHGKSEWLNDLIVSMCMEYDEKAVIGSFEIKPARTLLSMIRQLSGRKRLSIVSDSGDELPDEKKFDEALDLLNQHVMFYDYVGTAESKLVLEAYALAAKMYGVKFFVIDSLMCMDIEEEDNQGQKEFMNRLREFVIKYQVHIFLVCHSRKPSEKKREETYIPWKHDILGSVHISNLAWNVITVWRNISKGVRYQEALQNVQNAQAELETTRNVDHCASAKQKLSSWQKKADAIYAENDSVVAIRKQRDGTGELPLKQLWFDPASRQFRNKPQHSIRNYLSDFGQQTTQIEEDNDDEFDI